MIKQRYKHRNMTVCQSCKMIMSYATKDVRNYENVGIGIVCANCGELISIENEEELDL